MNTIQEIAREMKLASPLMAASAEKTRNQALSMIKDALQTHKDEIFAANKEDLQAAEENGIADSVKKD